MPSADSPTEEEVVVVDEARDALLEAITAELGDAVVASHILPGKDLWVRVANDAWSDTADYLRNRQRFRFFSWLSAIDWMQSPFGRSLDAAVDIADAPTEDAAESEYTGTGADGYTGGETRFQVISRVHSLTTQIGLNLKVDVGDDLSIGTWTKTYPGADWHEREVHEMFGIHFEDHGDMRNLYLPTDFEGFPLRKDFPLMARLVKPWPGIVDVEPMPEVEEPEAGEESSSASPSGATTSNPEDAS